MVIFTLLYHFKSSCNSKLSLRHHEMEGELNIYCIITKGDVDLKDEQIIQHITSCP